MASIFTPKTHSREIYSGCKCSENPLLANNIINIGHLCSLIIGVLKNSGHLLNNDLAQLYQVGFDLVNHNLGTYNQPSKI